MSDEQTSDDWAEARRLFEAGHSYRACAEGIGGRISYARIRRRAIAETWIQGELPAGAPTEAQVAAREKAVVAMGRAYAERKGELIDRLTEDALKLAAQLFAPTVARDAKIVPQGEGRSAIEISEVELDHPAFADQQKIVTSVAILVDKLQLLSGEATARTESGPLPDRAAVEAKLKAVRDELAERRDATAAQDASGASAAS